MPNIVIKRGLETNRLGITPLEGEFIYSTDIKKVYIGDGTTAGGIEISNSASNVSYNGSTNLSAINVEAALDELDSEKVGNAVTTNLSVGYTTDVEVLGSDIITPDMTTASIKTRTTVGNVTINFPTGGNGICHILFTIDGTDRTVTLGTNLKSVGGLPTLTASTKWVATIIRDSATHAVIQFQLEDA